MLQERVSIAGQYVMPGDAEWDAARQAWNLVVDQRPVAVAIPADVEDVVKIVRFARERGLQVAAQGTGHNASAMGSLEDTILLKTSALRSVEIDAQARRARVGAGVLWAEVAEPAAKLGLAALAGSSPDVGVVGYSLGGGVGWLARRYGLAANSIQAVELVTADGRLVRADHEHEPELFWALRGGGGNFGVVTALEFALYSVPEVYAGALFWPWERGAQVLHAWRDWVQTLPDEVTSVGRFLQFPPLPEVPEPLRGRSFVIIEATCLGDEADGARLLQPLRALAPELDTFAMIPPDALSALHMDPVGPTPGLTEHHLLGELPAAAIDALVEAAGSTSGSPLVSVEVRHLGGALATATRDGGALPALDAQFLLFSIGIPMNADIVPAIEAHFRRVGEAMAPWCNDRSYLNFAEQPTDTRSAYSAAAFERLQAVKAQYDPDNVFRANHPIAPGH